MEIILHNDANNIIRKSTDNYHSSRIPTDNQASVEQERKQCKHFSIRNYVSESRKRDANIGIPFSSHDHSSNALSTKLPPLEVKRFRRWCCERCIHETVSSETAVESQPMEGNKTISIIDTSIASTSDAKQGVEKLQLHFQECTPTNANDKINVASPSLVLINKDFEVASKKLSKESQNQVTVSNTSTGEREVGRLGASTLGITVVIPDVALKILSFSCERTTTKHPSSVTAKIEQAQEINKQTRRKQDCYIRNFRPRNTGKFCTMADVMERSSINCKDDKKFVGNEDIARDVDEIPTDRFLLNEITENKRGGIPYSDGGSSLTHFRRRVRRRRSLHKEINSKVEDMRMGGHADGKKLAMLESSVSPRKDKLVQNGHNTVQQLQETFSQPKSTEIMNHIGFASNKNKRSLFEYDSTSKIRYTKDKLGVKKKPRKKQRITQACNTNDIPMDIVELLAQKQQERYTPDLNDSTDDMSKLPESAKNIKDGNDDTQNSNIKGKRYLEFDLNEAPACASTELQSPSPYTGLSMNGSHLSIVESNTYYSPLLLSGNQTAIMNSLDNTQTNSNNTTPVMSLNQVISHVGNSPYSTNEPISASNLLKIIQNSSSFFMQNDYVWSHSNQCYEYLGIKNGQGVNICKPLPRFGVLGPQLQEEITNKFVNVAPTLGFGTTNFDKSGFLYNELNTTSKSIICDNVMNAIPTKSYDYTRVQIPTMSREGAFQPLKSSCKMEECLVNRNPAEDCEYVSQFSNVLKHNPSICQRGPNGKRSRKVRQIKTVLNG